MFLVSLKFRRVCFFLIFSSGAILFGQTDENENVVFYGKVIDSVYKSPVVYAHIYSESQQVGYVADSEGIFSIQASIGDTIVFSSIGYVSKIHYVRKNEFLHPAIIRMVQQPYEIKEVKINFPATYKEFKQAFLALDLNKIGPMPELPKFNPYKTPYLLDTNVIGSADFAIHHPITALYNKYNKEEQSKRKVWYLKQQELRQAEVDKKYNKELITEITGFTGDDLINFMGYCNFSFNFLYDSTDLEIVQEIEIRYKNYLKCCYRKNGGDSLGK